MPWAPAYASAADLAGWLGVDEDAELLLAADAASRAIDLACGRTFGRVDAPEARHYTAEWYRDRWHIDIDDLMVTPVTVEVDNDCDGTPEGEITDYRLTPVNAAAHGRPWTRIEVLPSSAVKPNGLRHGVRITARWGWTDVPFPIMYAALVQASRFWDRRENVGGMLSKHRVDDVEYGWASTGANQELDPDVLASIAPYRRVWAAA